MFTRLTIMGSLSLYFISTKLKLYSTCILPIFFYQSECWAISKVYACWIDALDQWCLRTLLGIKWYQFVRSDELRTITKQPNLTVTASFFVWTYCTYGWRYRCQDDPNGSPTWGMEETTMAPSHHMVEHHPVTSENSQPNIEWSSQPGSEPSSV